MAIRQHGDLIDRGRRAPGLMSKDKPFYGPTPASPSGDVPLNPPLFHRGIFYEWPGFPQTAQVPSRAARPPLHKKVRVSPPPPHRFFFSGWVAFLSN